MWVGVAYDVAGFTAEAQLGQTTSPAWLPRTGIGAPRYDFETRLALPASNASLALYFHAKAFVVADYSGHAHVVEKRYADGARTLVREAYDNPGAAGSNYTFSLR